MVPWEKLGVALIPNNGGELSLSRRDKEFSIKLSGIRGELMNSRVYNSEQELATLGCAHIATSKNAHVLVGGLGMGYTLAAALQATASSTTVTVAELIPEVIKWNQGPLGECAGKPLENPRTRVHQGDIKALLNTNTPTYNAILLDVDNGPEGLTHADNSWIYSLEGLRSIYNTLQAKGVLAIWSASPDPLFVKRLKKAGYNTSTHIARARKGKGSKHTIFIGQL
jgi:spermidine synthase